MTALLLRVADEIEAHPERYSQSCWQSCIAGTAARLLGCARGGDFPLYDPSRIGLLLGLCSHEERRLLFRGSWRPAPGLTVPEALRRIAGGESVDDVSEPVALVPRLAALEALRKAFGVTITLTIPSPKSPSAEREPAELADAAT